MHRWILAAATACMAACSPAPTATSDATPQPSAELAAAFPNCTWQETRGAGASIWGYTCDGDHLVVDDGVHGFVRETASGDGAANRWAVVRLFDIAPGASLDTILPAVRAASPADGIASCAFAPVQDHEGWYELRPTGDLLERYNAFIGGDAEGPSLPCGQMGPSESGFRYFFRLPGSDTKVAFIDPGGDLSPTDFSTLRAAG